MSKSKSIEEIVESQKIIILDNTKVYIVHTV